MSDIRYRIYPTLLDKFQSFCDTSVDVEADWNRDESGGYRRTEQELAAEREQALLDTVNRKPFIPTEAIQLGRAFNNCVDWLCTTSSRSQVYTAFDEDFTADFDGKIADEVTEMIGGDKAVAQYKCEAVLPTKYGDVLLYGYIDYWCPGGVVVDLKTTGRYAWPQYEKYWQRHVYPYAITASGQDNIDMFSFVIVKWKKPTKAEPYWRGEIHREDYNYDHAKSTAMLTEVCERMIEWLELNRKKITDTKIFNQ